MGTTATATTQPARGLDRDQAINLAQTITGSRQQFAEAFRRAQAGRSAVLEFEAVGSADTDRVAAMTLAFLRAAEGGWLEALCFACLEGKIVTGEFLAAAKTVSDTPRLASLQQLVDPQRGIRDGGLFVDRLPGALRQVCRIEIDGEPKGTGFLIRSDLVMTAYHVIKDLLQADNQEMRGSARRLRVRFDYSRHEEPAGGVVLREGLVCRVTDPWLVKTIPCTEDELFDRLPDDEEKLNNYWDFAVLRLAEVPGVARSGLEVSAAPVARGHRLMILQHPSGRPVGLDSSTVQRFLGLGGFRIVHEVNAEGGSSGSPCLNDDFKVVGIHQGAMPTDPARARNENRAIPMGRILGAWKPSEAPALGAVFSRLLAVDTQRLPQQPLFGRMKLQEWIGRAAAGGSIAGRERFLVVAGPKGSGKSLTLDVLRAMVPAGEHHVLEAKASDFASQATALDFASKYLLAPLGADARELPGLSQSDTSDNAWLNYQLVGDLLSVMDRSRKDRIVWVVLDELDEVALPDQGQVRKLLDLLYQRAERTPWLRFVLLGLEAVPVPEAVAFTERDFPGPASEVSLAADVGDYLLRLLETKGVFVPEAVIRASVNRFVKLCVDACQQDLRHAELMSKVVQETVAFERDLDLRPGEP